MTGRSNVVKLDRGVLSTEQQEKLNQFKIKTRIDNENYLRSHPEIEFLVGDFLRLYLMVKDYIRISGGRNVLLQRPVDIRDFAAEHFTNPNLESSTISKMDKNRELE